MIATCEAYKHTSRVVSAAKKENLILAGTSKEKLDKLLKDFENVFSDIFVNAIVCDLSKKEDRKSLS